MSHFFIIPVFIPGQGCPFQCVYCNQPLITEKSLTSLSRQEISAEIEKWLAFRKNPRTTTQISFYGGNFLGLAPKLIRTYLEVASDFVSQGLVQSIRFSTRPDTVTPQTLELISVYPVKTIELGVQSMDDHVLKLSRRGHNASQTTQAACLLKNHGYELGLQMMIGLPGDNIDKSLDTAQKLIDLACDFVRIYPTVVLKNTPLERWYREKKYIPLTLDQAVFITKTLYERFERKQIPVIRMGLAANDTLDNGTSVVAGPYHPAFGHLVLSRICLDKITSLLEVKRPESSKIDIYAHSRQISRIRGNRNQNIAVLKKKFKLDHINVIADLDLAKDQIVILSKT